MSLFCHVVLVYILSIGIRATVVLWVWLFHGEEMMLAEADMGTPWIHMIVALFPIPTNYRSIIFRMHNHGNKELRGEIMKMGVYFACFMRKKTYIFTSSSTSDIQKYFFYL